MNHNHLELNHNCDKRDEEKTPSINDVPELDEEWVELEGVKIPSKVRLDYLEKNDPDEYIEWMKRIAELQELQIERIRNQEIPKEEVEKAEETNKFYNIGDQDRIEYKKSRGEDYLYGRD